MKANSVASASHKPFSFHSFSVCMRVCVCACDLRRLNQHAFVSCIFSFPNSMNSEQMSLFSFLFCVLHFTEASVNESCFFNEQCEAFNFLTECRDGRCICRFEMSPIQNKDGTIECKGMNMKHLLLPAD